MTDQKRPDEDVWYEDGESYPGGEGEVYDEAYVEDDEAGYEEIYIDPRDDGKPDAMEEVLAALAASATATSARQSAARQQADVTLVPPAPPRQPAPVGRPATHVQDMDAQLAALLEADLRGTIADVPQEQARQTKELGDTVRREDYADPWQAEETNYPGYMDDDLQAYGGGSGNGEPPRIEHGTLPPHDSDEMAAAPGRSRRSGALFALVSIAVLGGAGALAYGLVGTGSNFSTPDIVRAPTTPYKIIPTAKEAAGDEGGDGATETVFDTSVAALPKSEERLVPAETSIPDLPGVPSADNTMAEQPQMGEASGVANSLDVGPRKVRTVLVRPDGSIITADEERPVGDAPPLGSDGKAGTAALMQPDPMVPDGLADGAPTGATRSAASANDPEVAPFAAAPQPIDGPQIASVDTATAPLTVPEPAVTANVPRPVERPPVPPTASTTSAPGLPNGPLVLNPNPTQVNPARTTTAQAPTDPSLLTVPQVPETRTTAPAATGSGYVVQIASVTSQDQATATAKRLQSRYSGVIGNMPTDIQRADLGAKGIYYRVRVGPVSSREEAIRICTDLKAAGGSCLVTR
ncbi:SPOR domain-containing protein [Hartmannibacter diazotrophicus]|uniref:SPOR domain-containing protein n=1 Tax=Hartmannibacter diazotrophicus TaxID=1482074 RepID=UPI0012FDF960|nr:SPOR domain-containing protein [Hartmannibacter diazotrophicus]